YIKARYSHIFIDEYQDSSLSQHELFLKINELGLCSIAVGDVWQSIYEFRGGNSELLLELVSNTECFKHFEINFNHRCHPSISNYASRLLEPSYVLLPADEIRVFRRRLNGNLKDAAVTISSWISGWLSSGEWKLEKANQIAILARKEKSLTLFCSGLNLNFRLYVDTPLDKIGTDCSDLYKDLLAYKYGSISTAQEFINKVFDGVIVDDNTLLLLRKKIKTIRNELKNEDLIHNFHDIACILGINSTEHTDGAVIRTISDDILVKQFKPLDDNEIQVMTLHKSKGLEFKLVFHLDLDEWSFPFREYNSEDR
ncbi:UvrD-helicase domain-containing protein, partial [Escherichia coli]